jgi:putative ABC transport system substrate-binding protein
MLNRRRFLQAVSASLLAAPIAAAAQPAGKVPRIGVLSSAVNPTTDAFRQGLRGAGYVDGQNLQIEYRSAERNVDRLPALAADLVRLKVDVIVTMGGLATRAAKDATTSRTST